MGRNARRRKEAKQAGRTPSTAGTSGATSVRWLDDNDVAAAVATPGAFSRLARRKCDECGGSDLAWTDLNGLREAVSDDQRARVDEVAGFVGPASEAWLCRTCGNFGVLGGFEASAGW
ncbi:hypothetical protein [Cellulomonas sp. C5510]|uniref:hypothetical protein n=1 Tax=Cellulomonas sp. C5510 TaxID=2871170 RepID=UPI001C9549AD|nr:hypothetical protein [Cellulomonas sp. C5510]QZN87740.1 hypothetical protein K5O09_18785 [Cellulomonas sp. C5510]